jgi:hypothetical protein
MYRAISRFGYLLLIASLVVLPTRGVRAITATLPEGTRIYVELIQHVSGKRGDATVGQVVQARVWRDVEHGGTTFIKAGTFVSARIDSLKHANIAGVKGKMSIGAIETKCADGQTITLTGGYNKEGKSRVAAAVTVSLLLFWPAIFIPGKAAELPTGTIFDAFTVGDVTLAVADNAGPKTISLSALGAGGFSAEFLIENLTTEKKPKYFELLIIADDPSATSFVIDRINGKPIEPIPLEITGQNATEDGTELRATVKIKTLTKVFSKGINRVEVAYVGDDGRVGAEAILNVQM